MSDRKGVGPRVAWLDLLRASAAFGVVLLHTNGVLMRDFFDAPTVQATGAIEFLRHFVSQYTKWCVPAFVMASGYLLLPQPAEPIGRFWKRRLLRLGPPLLAWYAFYLGESLWCHRKPDTIAGIIASFFDGTLQPTPHLWFLPMFLSLMLALPLLQRMVQPLSALQYGVVVAATFAWTVATPPCRWLANASLQPQFTIITSFIPFVPYLLFGGFVAASKIRISTAWLIAACVFAGGIGFALRVVGLSGITVAFGYDRLDAIVLSTSVFLLARTWGERLEASLPLLAHALSIVSRYALGVYLIHVAILDCLPKPITDWGKADWYENGLAVVVFQLMIALAVWAASLMLAVLMRHCGLQKLVC